MLVPWVVEFHGRAGGRARAVFDSEGQARAFAERHAGITSTMRLPLKWSDTGDPLVLSTAIGDYRIAPMNAAQRGPVAR